LNYLIVVFFSLVNSKLQKRWTDTHAYKSNKSAHFKLYQTVKFSYYLPDGSPMVVFVCICNLVMWG